MIASETAKEGTKLGRNYVVSTESGTLTVTDAAMGIAASPAEKFYDAEPTNIAWGVTNATGGVITDATISLREKGTTEWIQGADFALYVDTTNATGFVSGEGFDRVPMTDDSYVILPGTQPNVIDDAKVTFKENTNPGNYLVFYIDGALEIRVRKGDVHGDVEIPEESKEQVDEKLEELVKHDPKAGEEPFVKIQMAVTKAENLTEKTRTTKTEAEAKEERQIDEITRKVVRPDWSDFVDIIIGRTYDPIVEAPGHEYCVDDWD